MVFIQRKIAKNTLLVGLGLALLGCGDDGGSDGGESGTSDDTGTLGSTSMEPTSEDSTTEPATSGAEGSSSMSDTGAESDTGGESSDTGDGTTGGTGSDSGSETAGIDCSMLDETGCAAEEACVPIEGAEVLMLGDDYCYSTVPEYLGCRSADVGCAEVETFACEEVEVPTTYYFPDACVPDGWVSDGCPNTDPTPIECTPT